MNTISEIIESADWEKITENMNRSGFAVLPQILHPEQCENLISQYQNQPLYRKTIVMERYRFGLGEYKYFRYPLPGLIQQIRESVYPRLVPIANNWMKVLNIYKTFPKSLDELHTLCRENAQTEPTVLILKYGKGGHNTLHQDLYGEIFFPIQLVIFLNDPEKEYEGGEFVLLQQTPRAQSKATVLKPKKGDVLLFTTNFRPAKGGKGYYRMNMKHGVSEVHAGERYTLGVIFHDAQS